MDEVVGINVAGGGLRWRALAVAYDYLCWLRARHTLTSATRSGAACAGLEDP